MSYFYCAMEASLFLCALWSRRWVSGFAMHVGHGLWPCQIYNDSQDPGKNIWYVSCLHLHNCNYSTIYTRV